jgi:hypothetical protein
MYENILAWVGLALVFFLCLPVARVQRYLLGLYGLGLRLGMLALVGAAAYLWFWPTQLPPDVAEVVRKTPLLNSILPDPGTPAFAICAVSLIAVAVLPLVAVIDACRRVVGRREPVVLSGAAPAQTVPAVLDDRSRPLPQAPAATPPRFGRRAAADAMAEAGSTR